MPTIATLIPRAIRAPSRRARAGHNNAWEAYALSIPSDTHCVAVYHQGAMMINGLVRSDGIGISDWVLGVGGGSASDQQGMNAILRASAIPAIYSRIGGHPRYEGFALTRSADQWVWLSTTGSAAPTPSRPTHTKPYKRPEPNGALVAELAAFNAELETFTPPRGATPPKPGSKFAQWSNEPVGVVRRVRRSRVPSACSCGDPYCGGELIAYT